MSSAALLQNWDKLVENRKRGHGFMNEENENGVPQTEKPSAKGTIINLAKKLLDNRIALIVITALITTAVNLNGRSVIANVYENPTEVEKLDTRTNSSFQVLETKLSSKIEIMNTEMTSSFDVLEEKINSTSSTVDVIREDIRDLKAADRTINETLAVLYKGSNSNSNTASGTSSGNIVPNPEFMVDISNSLDGRGTPGSAPKVQLLSDTVIARVKGTDVELTAGELANHKVLLPYTSGGQEVFFYGQINENGCWDGNCILNTYQDDKLVLITDAVYINGNLISCKQVFSYTMSSNRVVWAYADRLQEESYSSGETWLYAKNDDYLKDFGLNDVTADKILTADGFRETIDSSKVAYYYGNTSDGYFNDTTGDAYIIHYFEDGSIRLLYSGNFSHGQLHDLTGNAWYIVRQIDTKYMCYKGKFRDNGEYHDKKFRSFSSPLSALSPEKQEEFWKCWEDKNIPVFLGNSLALEDINLLTSSGKFDGDGPLDWGYLVRPTV